MSNQNVPSVTLQTAVLMQVKEFASNNQQFSVHDITRTIRTKTSQGELEIPEVEVTGASFRFDIPHAKVKALFDELWRTGVFDQFLTLSRNFNGMYFEYTPSVVQVPTPDPTVVTPSPFVQPPPSGLTPPVNPAPVSNATKPDRSVITDRVELYLNNCAGRNFRPTLKQVQSAIKRGDVSTGWTCEELQDIIESTLGWDVVPDPDYVSASQVAIV